MAGIYARIHRDEFKVVQQEYLAMVKEERTNHIARMFPIYWDELMRIRKLCYRKVRNG